ncbi:hypothetical protein GCM10017688_26040 [Streptomyces ramulosus]
MPAGKGGAPAEAQGRARTRRTGSRDPGPHRIARRRAAPDREAPAATEPRAPGPPHKVRRPRPAP